MPVLISSVCESGRLQNLARIGEADPFEKPSHSVVVGWYLTAALFAFPW